MVDEKKITEVVIDPIWRLCFIETGGVRLPLLVIEHPRHGDIAVSLSPESMESMHKALGDMRGPNPLAGGTGSKH